ncbi:MAG: hypothetical protein KDK71_04895 [Chlamydiia bacterium]|nr:hypothetical protein [Chlamydiia bacterium]
MIRKLEFFQSQRLDFSPIEAAPIQEIGAMQKGLKSKYRLWKNSNS